MDKGAAKAEGGTPAPRGVTQPASPNISAVTTHKTWSISRSKASLYDPTVLRFFHDHSVPLTWLCSFSVMMFSVSM